MSDSKLFKFKHFEINQSDLVFKVGTDAFVLGAWIGSEHSPEFILDVGTGTGVLALMAAQYFPNSKILAVDNNSNAADLASENFSKSQFGSNCTAKCLNFLQMDENQKFDLIISNPPYFLDSSSPNNAVMEQSKHIYSNDLLRFFIKVKALLSPAGKFCVIYPIDERYEQLATQAGLFVHSVLNVYGKPGLLKRQCVAYGLSPTSIVQNELIIRDSTGNYTSAYKNFTAEFHGVDL